MLYGPRRIRRVDGWSARDYRAGESLALTALGFDLAVNDVFRDELEDV